MLTQFVFYFLITPIGHAYATPAQKLAQHPDFAPIWMQYTKIILSELDHEFLLITGDSHYLIKWNETGDGLLVRGVTLEHNEEAYLEFARKGKWICSVSGAGKKSKCFKKKS